MFVSLTVLPKKIFGIRPYMQTAQPNSYMLAMLIGTIDLSNFILFSLALTLRVARSMKSNICWIHFHSIEANAKLTLQMYKSRERTLLI